MSTPKMRIVLLSAISLLGSLANLAGAAPADLPDQGPRATSMVGEVEVWQVGGTTCKVRDYGVLMPTMVYNCAYMPSICKNIKKYLGSLPVAGQEHTFHYDRAPQHANSRKKRKDTRRDAVCPDNWIKGRCPELYQPDWTGYINDGTKFGPYKALLLRKEVWHLIQHHPSGSACPGDDCDLPILSRPRNTPTKNETRPADSFLLLARDGNGRQRKPDRQP
ncbi:hypothetical protein C8A05DRAFT_20393 [Staphylotrichum tortipilum]|uniref:Secreted protein n=1 Tax=Staphylotrichum tortipilum TaxID=2831512 RepID=A0AAN6M9B9_9PEZI|nr:hypothetical protein C8A05DRAFT_20393 [Staphylotrichum longicolle]